MCQETMRSALRVGATLAPPVDQAGASGLEIQACHRRIFSS